MNYACDFGQSETEKYFEWMIIIIIIIHSKYFSDSGWLKAHG